MNQLTTEQAKRAQDSLELAVATARKLAGPNEQLYEELLSACNLGLCKAAQAFDPSLSPQGEEGWGPFAAMCARREALKVLQSRQSQQNRAFHYMAQEDFDVVSAEHTPEQVIMARESIIPRQASAIYDLEVTAPVDGACAWVSRLRAACFDAVSESDMADIMRAVVVKAKAGDLAAARLLLDYLAGGKSGVRVRAHVPLPGGRHDRDT